MEPSTLSPEFMRVAASLAKLVVLSMLLERALVLVFDYRWYQAKLDGKGLKTPISFSLTWLVCHYYGFDVLSALFEPGRATPMGIFLTGAVAAGGSAGAITVFQGLFGFTKDVQHKLAEAKTLQAEAAVADARFRKLEAETKIEALAEGGTTAGSQLAAANGNGTPKRSGSYEIQAPDPSALLDLAGRQEVSS